MSVTDLNRLRELAQAATPGPWAEAPESGTNGWYAVEYLNEDARGTDVALRITSAQDAEFIAAINPAVVLALIERAEKAEASIAAAVALHHIDPYDTRRTFNRCVCEEIWPCSTISTLTDVEETSNHEVDGENDAVDQKD